MIMAFSILPTASLAASSVEEALGEIDIYNGGKELSYLMINGRVRTLIYTYYNYVNSKGETKEIPAYCVNPNITGVPQTVAPGESIDNSPRKKHPTPKFWVSWPMAIRPGLWRNWVWRIKSRATMPRKSALWCYLRVTGTSITSR